MGGGREASDLIIQFSLRVLIKQDFKKGANRTEIFE